LVHPYCYLKHNSFLKLYQIVAGVAMACVR